MSITTVISTEEEVTLVKKGLENLLLEIDRNINKINLVFSQYPALKEAKFADQAFKNQVFAKIKSLAGRFFYHQHSIKEYSAHFPFIVDMALADQSLQNQLSSIIPSAIEALVRALNYHNDEWEQYPEDRLGGLFEVEMIYNSPLISQEVKKAHIPALLKTFTKWANNRSTNPWFTRVYTLVKASGATKKEIGDALYNAWHHDGRQDFYSAHFNANLLRYEEFPQDKLDDRKVRKDMRKSLLYRIQCGDNETVTTFWTQYSFLKDQIQTCLALIAQNDPTNNTELKDEATLELMSTVRGRIRNSLMYRNTQHAVRLDTTFPGVLKTIPRAQVVQGIYAGMDKHTGGEKDINAEKKELLAAFPLSHDEATAYVVAHPRALPAVLDFFPGYNFDAIYTVDAVKDELHGRIANNREHIDYIKKSLNISSLDAENIRIQSFLDELTDAVKEGKDRGYNLRSWKISERLTNLGNICEDKKNLKEKLATPDVKKLFLRLAYLKAADHEFADEFNSNRTIEEVCKNEFFPLSKEEVNKEIYKLFIESCKYGTPRYWSDWYPYIQEKIEAEDKSLKEACIQGAVYLLGADQFKSPHDIDSKCLSATYFINNWSFKAELKNNADIINAKTLLKKHFMSSGRLDKLSKVEGI